MPDPVRKRAKIVLIGESGVGKTSLIRRFLHGAFDGRYVPTVGTAASRVELEVPDGDGGIDIDLTIFDIRGERGFRDKVRDAYFHGASGYLAVCDATREETVSALRDWIPVAVEHTGGAPGFIVVNKTDIGGRRLAGAGADPEKLAGMFGASVAYTSAKTGAGVDDAFGGLALQVTERNSSAPTASSTEGDFRSRILDLLEKRGSLGANRDLLFRYFPGLTYAELEGEVRSLEDERLVRVVWRGPGDFTVYAVGAGFRAVVRV